MMRIENPKVIAAIIDFYNLPINKKCDVIIAEDKGIFTFIYDEYANPQITCTVNRIWANFNIRWWGPEFYIWRSRDIGHLEIDCKTGESRWCCCYNTIGKIKYGRYYEPSMD